MAVFQAFRLARNILPWHTNNIFTIFLYLRITPVFLLKCPIFRAFRRFSLIFRFALNPRNSPQIYADSRANGVVSGVETMRF